MSKKVKSTETTEKSIKKLIAYFKGKTETAELLLVGTSIKIRIMSSGNATFRFEDSETKKLVSQFSFNSIIKKKYK